MTYSINQSSFRKMVESILLQSGLEVSAKFKGAFCEARIKSVEPNVKCKVRFTDGKTIETPHKNLTLMGNTLWAQLSDFLQKLFFIASQ